MNVDDAVREVKTKFPFPAYFTDDLMPWKTVGMVVQKYLASGARLYDFGAGACDKTAVASLLGCQCTAVDDLDDDWYKRGDNISKIESFAQSMSINFSRAFIVPDQGTYDMVMLNDVLEHIHDSPRDLLLTLVDGLKDGGLLFVTVPNLANIRKRIALMRGRSNLADFDLYYWYQGRWRGPQREYVRRDLISLCDNLELERLELSTVHHMLQNLPSIAHPIYRAVTTVFPDWRDTWLLVARKPEGWRAKRQLTDREFGKVYGRSSKASLYNDETS